LLVEQLPNELGLIQFVRLPLFEPLPDIGA
jgi:hypothetical protein